MDDLGLTTEVQESLLEEMNDLLKLKRDQVTSVLQQYMVSSIRKKPGLVDVDKRVADFNKRIEEMVKAMTLGYVDEEFVVKVTGSAEETWKTLLRGSDWFEPVPDAMEIMLSPLCP